MPGGVLWLHTMALAVVGLCRLTAPAYMAALAASAGAVSIMGRDQQHGQQSTYIPTFWSLTLKICVKLDKFNHFRDPWNLDSVKSLGISQDQVEVHLIVSQL